MKTNHQATILVIEDDHDLRVELREGLERAGYYVISATNGANALEILSGIMLPDMILLDLNMPIMNGDQFLEAVRMDPRLQKIPVMQISPAASSRREGIYCFVPKPFDIDYLLQAIGSGISRESPQHPPVDIHNARRQNGDSSEARNTSSSGVLLLPKTSFRSGNRP